MIYGFAIHQVYKNQTTPNGNDSGNLNVNKSGTDTNLKDDSVRNAICCACPSVNIYL